MVCHLRYVRTAVVQVESCTGDRQGVLHAAYTALLVSCTVFTIVKIMYIRFRDVDPDLTRLPPPPPNFSKTYKNQNFVQFLVFELVITSVVTF